eukprot:TRINITY_DN10891_c0_g1_i1.p1 TRINITY_DN10891_c0_g1~~TRINITY_DN10891_c0_g1_i1.p1  ORF type:complete len:275 (-),score=78.37 TRINITY_DN10891_c0_g1_i1:1-825(-)
MLDTSGKNIPLSQVVINDESWVLKRVNTTQINFLHNDIPIPIAKKFGVRMLNEVVREERDSSGEENAVENEELQQLSKKWSDKLTSPKFQESLLRLLSDPQQCTQSIVEDSTQLVETVKQTVNKIQVHFVDVIMTRFIHLVTGENVTLNRSNTSDFFVEQSGHVWISRNKQSDISIIEHHLALAINRAFGEKFTNEAVLVIQKILQEDEAKAHQILDVFKVKPAPEALIASQNTNNNNNNEDNHIENNNNNNNNNHTENSERILIPIENVQQPV